MLLPFPRRKFVTICGRYCERRLKEEAENLGAVMAAADTQDMIRSIQRVLLEVNIDAILSSGLAALVDSSRFAGDVCVCVCV